MASRRFPPPLLLLIALILLIGCGGRPAASPTSPPILLPPSPSPLPTRPPSPPATATPTPRPSPTATAAPSNPLTTPPPASATEESEPIAGWAFVKTLQTRLHAEPAGPVIGTLRAGERLDILGASPDRVWLKVRYQPEADKGPQTGWVLTSQVQRYVDMTDIPVAEAMGDASSAHPAPAEATRGEATVTAHRLNLRAGPGLHHAILGALTSGQTVKLLGRSDDGQWLKILTEDGEIGWAAAAWLRSDVAIEALPIIEKAATGAPRPIPPQGLILLQDRPGGAIYAIRADGTGLRRLSAGLDPALSPDATQAAFTRWSPEGDGVYILDLATGRERLVWRDNKPRSPAWSPDAQALVFDHITGERICRSTPMGCLSDEQLRAIFQGDECGALPLLGRVCIEDLPQQHRPILGLRTLSLSTGEVRDPLANHARAPRHHPQQPWLIALSDAGVIRVNETDDPPRLLIQHGSLGAPVFSPDGRFIYVSRRDGDSWNIWRYRSDGSDPTALTQPPPLRDRPIHNVAPAPSPDGRFLLFLTDRRGKWEVWIMRSDGSRPRPFAAQALAGLTFDFDFGPSRMFDWQ